MENQYFEIVGACRIDNDWKPFRKVVTAANENLARERVFTDIGSKHHLKRNYIKIESVNVVAGE